MGVPVSIGNLDNVDIICVRLCWPAVLSVLEPVFGGIARVGGSKKIRLLQSYLNSRANAYALRILRQQLEGFLDEVM